MKSPSSKEIEQKENPKLSSVISILTDHASEISVSIPNLILQ